MGFPGSKETLQEEGSGRGKGRGNASVEARVGCLSW